MSEQRNMNSTAWPYGQLTFVMEVKDARVEFLLRSSTYELYQRGEAFVGLTKYAPDDYEDRCTSMMDRNPDMTWDQIHHRVLFHLWVESGGIVG